MYSISVLEEQGIVFAFAEGRVTATDLNETRRKIAKICRSHDLTKVLIDDRAVTEIPSFEDIYQFASTFFENGIPPFIKLAHIINNKALSDNEFLETVAVNRGANLKTFKDKSEAMRWLMH